MLVVGMFNVVVVMTSTAGRLLSARVEVLPLKETVSVAVAVLAVTASSQLFPADNVNDAGVLHPLLEPAVNVKSVEAVGSELAEIPPL